MRFTWAMDTYDDKISGELCEVSIEVIPSIGKHRCLPL
jgi:hypothetical protein